MQYYKKIKYHIYVCIFRRNTHLAITKVPASCRNLSNLTPRSIGTSVEEDIDKKSLQEAIRNDQAQQLIRLKGGIHLVLLLRLH